MIKATEIGTKQLAKAYNKINYRPLGNTGLLVSPVGFGSYRIDVRSEMHTTALRKALLSGINLIDTSANYTDGNSELLIGNLVNALVGSNMIARESIVIVSKGGYIQGQNYLHSQQRKQQGRPFPDLVEFAEGLEHCIHPIFLEDQISRSLHRLNMPTIDIYLLHNPEYFLTWIISKGYPIEDAREEYYKRIEQAFRYLEEQVDKGRIQYYGISSNTFVSLPDDNDFTSLEKVFQIAESISPQNHFKVVEFPMNLIETNAGTLASQCDNKTVLEYAKEKNLAVLINRPINSIYNSQIVRLSNILADQKPSDEEIIKEIQLVIDLEENVTSEGKVKEFITKVSFARQLIENWKGFNGIEHWNMSLNQYFIPGLLYCNQVIGDKEGKVPDEDKKIITEYVRLADKALKFVTDFYRFEHYKRTENIKRLVYEIEPEWANTKSLSQMAIRSLRSTEEINCVLVGMRHTAYVEDVIEELYHPIDKINRKSAWIKAKELLKSI